MTKVEYEEWCATFVEACDQATEGSATGLFAVDDGDAAILLGVESEDQTVGVLAQLDGLFAQRRRSVAAMATRVNWSPTEDGESSPAWALTIVDRDRPARFLVRRHVEDERWWSLNGTETPWFMLSTASSLRAALNGAPLAPIKQVGMNMDLLRTPVDVPRPPTDQKGRL